MEGLTPEIARLFAAKEDRRHKLAALPFAEKVRAVVRMQEMAAPLLRARGRQVRVWPACSISLRRVCTTEPR
ncbi:MAG: hypothetical protein HYU75_05835 [Betaproteobacteria bacterium]|nr:hypothetical protein [Betaproteobacteria bacterium]